ncbi:PqqD family protein [Micromonospora sp. NPDC049175]|uniref:PqqD family protein n=1 Tax=Micromonospora sp. NPDC049175 TaxID=3364266 RepID=UPI0037195C70
MNDSEVPRVSLYSRVRRVAGALVVAGRTETEEPLELDETAELIWQSIDGRRTVRQIAARVARQYGEEEVELVADVAAFLDDLTARRLVEWPGDARRPPS